MSPFVKLLLIVLVAVVVFYVVTRFRNAQQRGPVSFQPVSQLPVDQRAAIESAIAKDQLITAIKLYREATGAGLAASKAAIETHSGKRGA